MDIIQGVVVWPGLEAFEIRGVFDQLIQKSRRKKTACLGEIAEALVEEGTGIPVIFDACGLKSGERLGILRPP